MSSKNRQSKWIIPLGGLVPAVSCACLTTTFSHTSFGRLSPTVSRARDWPSVVAQPSLKSRWRLVPLSPWRSAPVAETVLPVEMVAVGRVAVAPRQEITRSS
jgi:hypothetical protein